MYLVRIEDSAVDKYPQHVHRTIVQDPVVPSTYIASSRSEGFNSDDGTNSRVITPIS